MKTERLHYDDPLALELTSRVVAHSEWDGAPTVVLDRTVFYPESGGQMGDRGELGGAAVVDVQVAPDGQVHHRVRGALPTIGAEVHGRVDELRRRSHMALHTGQHALSRALLDRLGAVTVSSRLGATACTLDVDVADLDMEALRPVEEAVHRLIDEDRPVRQFFPTDEELEVLELRKPPPAADRVRVVDIEGWDVTPCGGTHVTHTAQIELLFLRSVERYKGGSRITFEAGPRAREALQELAGELRDAATELRCAPLEVSKIVAGLKAKLDRSREEAGALRAGLAASWAERLEGESPIVASIVGADPSSLKAVAARLATGDRLVALAAPGPDGTHVVFARGPESDVSCGDLLRTVAEAGGGRGGGRPEHSQGKLPSGADFEALVRRALRG